MSDYNNDFFCLNYILTSLRAHIYFFDFRWCMVWNNLCFCILICFRSKLYPKNKNNNKLVYHLVSLKSCNYSSDRQCKTELQWFGFYKSTYYTWGFHCALFCASLFVMQTYVINLHIKVNGNMVKIYVYYSQYSHKHNFKKYTFINVIEIVLTISKLLDKKWNKVKIFGGWAID